jgi:hypothetical protein
MAVLAVEEGGGGQNSSNSKKHRLLYYDYSTLCMHSKGGHKIVISLTVTFNR